MPKKVPHTSRNVRKRIYDQVRPVKTKIRLRIRAVWSESSLSAFWIAMDGKFLHTDKEDWLYCTDDLSLFFGRTYQKVHFFTMELIWNASA